MKAILIACLLVATLAVSPLEKYEAIARQDDCVANVFDLLKPEIDAKLAELKTVPIFLFRTRTSLSRLKFWPFWRRERPCLTSAMPRSLNPSSEILSNGTELPSSLLPTASRMLELSFFLLTLSSRAQLTTPMMSSSPSSDTFSEDRELLIVPSSSTSSYDRSHHI